MWWTQPKCVENVFVTVFNVPFVDQRLKRCANETPNRRYNTDKVMCAARYAIWSNQVSKDNKNGKKRQPMHVLFDSPSKTLRLGKVCDRLFVTFEWTTFSACKQAKNQFWLVVNKKMHRDYHFLPSKWKWLGSQIETKKMSPPFNWGENGKTRKWLTFVLMRNTNVGNLSRQNRINHIHFVTGRLESCEFKKLSHDNECNKWIAWLTESVDPRFLGPDCREKVYLTASLNQQVS